MKDIIELDGKSRTYARGKIGATRWEAIYDSNRDEWRVSASGLRSNQRDRVLAYIVNTPNLPFPIERSQTEKALAQSEEQPEL